MHDLGITSTIKEIRTTANVLIKGFPSLPQSHKNLLLISASAHSLLVPIILWTLEAVVDQTVVPKVGITRSVLATVGTIAIIGSGIATNNVIGITAARKEQIPTGAIQGALVGAGITGCILALPTLLGSSTIISMPDLLKALGAGGGAGALSAVCAAIEARLGGEGDISLKMLPGAFLGVAVANAATTTDYLLQAGGVGCMVGPFLSGLSIGMIPPLYTCSLFKKALEIDNNLLSIIKRHASSNKENFKELLDQKAFFSPINLTDEPTSYSKLLHKVIQHKAPLTWFKMLLNQPEIDLNFKNAQGQTPAHSIVQKFYESESEEQTIYLQYLEYLLTNSRRDLNLLDNDNQIIFDIILTNLSSRQKQTSDNDRALLTLLVGVVITLDELREKISKMSEDEQISINQIIDPYYPSTKSAKTDQVGSPSVETKDQHPLLDLTTNPLQDADYQPLLGGEIKLEISGVFIEE